MVGGAGLGFDLVGAEAGLGEEAVAHGIGESADVTGSGEDGLVGEDGAVEAEDVIALLDVFTPPEFLEVAFHLGAERAVVPAAIESAVEFCGLENEAFAFAEGNDFFHAGGVGLIFVGHDFSEAGIAGGGNAMKARGERFFWKGCEVSKSGEYYG